MNFTKFTTANYQREILWIFIRLIYLLFSVVEEEEEDKLTIYKIFVLIWLEFLEIELQTEYQFQEIGLEHDNT